tara:strand:+ start:1076 stop:1840 length:765 start_codon:yes stop_codon:yes gene_type:complete
MLDARAQSNGNISARIVPTGNARAGEELLIRVEVSWPDRPERHLPGTPSLELPTGAVSRLGSNKSRFDGGATLWIQQIFVTLPERSGPWQIGPAVIPVKSPRGGAEELVAGAVRVGRTGKTARLIGQGIGNSIIVVLALLLVLQLYRKLVKERVGRDSSVLSSLCRRAEALAPGSTTAGSQQDFLEALLGLRLALPGSPGHNAPPNVPDTADLESLLDAVRFGGEQIPEAKCQQLLNQLLTAATDEMSQYGGEQ